MGVLLIIIGILGFCAWGLCKDTSPITIINISIIVIFGRGYLQSRGYLPS